MYSDEGGRGFRGRGRGQYQGNRSHGRYDDGYREENFQGRSSSGYRGRGGGWSNTGYRGRGRGRGRSFRDPDDVQYLKIMRGHEDSVTTMIFDEASGQLFSGSKDCTVRVWDHQTGESTKTVQVGGQVYCMLYEGGFLFVGIFQPGNQDFAHSPAVIKVFHLQAGTEDTLQGHLGPINALAAGNNMLFSGGQDTAIRVWQYSQEGAKFLPHVELTAAQNGHSFPVSSLLVCNGFLFSADFKGCMKVWDLSSGQCLQTIEHAHEAVTMSLIPYKNHVLSGSIDGSIRVWPLCEPAAPGTIIHPQPAYVHPPKEGNVTYGKILALNGTTAPDNQDILLSSCSDDNVIRLWQLPDFKDRGHLNAIRNCRAIMCGRGHIFAGDYDSGNIKVWRWNK